MGFSPLELAPDLQVDSVGRFGRIQLSQGAAIAVSTAGSRNAGDIMVRGGQLSLSGESRLEAATSSQGNAGAIDVQVGTLTLTNGGTITVDTSGPGQGGRLTVTAREAILLAGQDRTGQPARLVSMTQGQGGNLQISAQRIDLRDGGTIAASSTGDGAGGTILLLVGETFRSQQGLVTAAAERGAGGNIQLGASSLVQLLDSELTTTSRGGREGNISLRSPVVVVDRSQIIANAFAGPGGNLLINAEVFLADPTSNVVASGTIGITGAVTALTGSIAPLPQTFMDVATLLPVRCAARAQGGKYSSLVLGGLEGRPLEPSDVLPSPLLLEARLAADPALTGDPHRQTSVAKFALLAGQEKALPRFGCPK